MVRTLGSAALAASLLAADLVLLVLLLNGEVGLAAAAPALFASLFLPYAAGATVAYVALTLVGGLLQWWPRSLRRPIEGLPWFTSLALLSVTAAATLYWFNLLSYRDSIPLESVRALERSAAALTASAVALAAVGASALATPWRPRGGSAAVVVLASTLAVLVPLALRPAPAPGPHAVPLATEMVAPVRRVVLVGIDGLGPEQVRSAGSRGRPASFARILKRGAHGPLATLSPTEAPPIWTTILTGRLPRDHGVKSFSSYRLRGSQTVFELLPRGAAVGLLERHGLVSKSPATASSRKRRAIWTALNAFGIQTGVVRMWGTHPAERVQGFMLSHYFHLLAQDPVRAAATLHPPDLLAEVRARAVTAEADSVLLSRFIGAGVETPARGDPWRRELLERALAPDMTYRRAGSVLRAAYDPPFFATYYYGLDVVGHAFMRFAQPDSFGDVPAQDVRRYGQVIDRYADMLAQWVADAAQSLRSEEILIVVSGYGMRPAPFWRRPFSGLTGDPTASGSHAGAPEGFLMAVGDGVKAGAVLDRASVLDVAPTILYLMGLPVARDMEGRVLTELLEEDFARTHPVTFIPSYESLAVTPLAGSPNPDLPPLPDEGS
jgi:predicted AlkP superfamily phosphohydrolase/phosphomutase